MPCGLSIPKGGQRGGFRTPRGADRPKMTLILRKLHIVSSHPRKLCTRSFCAVPVFNLSTNVTKLIQTRGLIRRFDGVLLL
jgi:hypothetical protein